MAIYNVVYINLRAGPDETSRLVKGLEFNHIDGVQRGLIALRDPQNGEIKDSWVVYAYFHKYDGTSSQVQFKTESHGMNEEAIKRKLRENQTVEVLADVNPDRTVTLAARRDITKPESLDGKPEYLRLEDYLLRHGAFSRAAEKREKAAGEK